MDIQKTVEELISKFTNDRKLTEQFKKDPAGTIKNLIGSAVSGDELNAIITAVKAKVNIDNIKDTLGSLFGK